MTTKAKEAEPRAAADLDRKARDGQPYYNEDGTALSESALRDKEEDRQAFSKFSAGIHNKALVAAAQTMTCTGLRLSDPKTDHANGLVVTFTGDEQNAIMNAVRKILAARG